MAKKVAKKKATKAATKKKATKTTKKKKAKAETPDDEEAPKKKAAKKKKAKRKSRAKKDEDIRQRVFWCVFNHAMKPVHKYAFNQKKAAVKKAAELSDGKPPHFVQKVKEAIEEEEE